MRNVFCSQYSKCLDSAVIKNMSWDCSECPKRNLKEEIETDFTNEMLLLWAIFKPDLYDLYRQAETQKAFLKNTESE